MSSHEGIAGNEEANLAGGVIRSQLRKGWKRLWESASGLRQSKKLISFQETNTNSLLTLSRSELRSYIGLVTGYCPLRYHLNKIGVAEDNTCRLCHEEEETAEHILYRCEAVSGQRSQDLGKTAIAPQQIKEFKP